MLLEKIYPHSKNFSIECEQIEFWDNSLSEIQGQLGIFIDIIQTQNDFFELKSNFLNDLSNNYYSGCQKLSSEPSNIFYLTQLVLEMLTKSTKVLNYKMKSLYMHLSSTIPELIQNIILVRENVVDNSDKTMNELSNLINLTKNYQKNFEKIKTNLDEAQLKKKKLETKTKYTYNVTVKEKAENKVLENMQEMEKLLPKLKSTAKEVEVKKEKFNMMMKENFEIIMMNVFKNLTHLHQCFFLLSKVNYDINTECVLIYQNAFKQFANLSININDYTERKFAELQGIKFDSLDMINLTDELIQTNPTQLIDICDSVQNYIMIFLTCLRVRKNVMKNFLTSFNQIMKYEEDSRDSFRKKESKFGLNLSNFSLIGEGTLKSWKNIFNTFHIVELMSKKNVISEEIALFITETRNEMKCFCDKWVKMEKKIIEKKNELIALKDSKKKTEKIKKISTKLISVLNTAFDFIKSQISSIRDKDTKRINRLLELFAKSAKVLQNISQKIVDFSQKEIENSTYLDIFDECQEIFSKYFTKFKITNYEKLLEKIKVNILLKTDFQKDKLGQSTYEKLNEFSSNQTSFVTQMKPENEKTNNNINLYFNDNEEHKSDFSSVSSLDKKKIEKEILLENENIEQSKQEKTFSSPKDIHTLLSSEDDKINFINTEKFNTITEHKNPYQNFKEPELAAYKQKIEKKKDNISIEEKKSIELEEDENIVDTFLCAYREKILLQGKMCLTTKKIVFTSLFNSSTIFGKGGTKLIIPLKDIISISKKSNLIFKNSIEIKTEKAALFFTSFLFRDSCYQLISSQLNEIKAMADKNKSMTLNQEPTLNASPKAKLGKLKLKKSKKIAQMLQDIDFFNKLDAVHKERMDEFNAKYQKNENFLPIEAFKYTYVDEIVSQCPPCLLFSSIFNQENVVDEFEHQKGFYESIYIDRNDKNIVVSTDEIYKEIPEYFKDFDYVISLFSNFNKEELIDFIDSVKLWPDIFKFRVQLTHPIKKYFIGPDKVNLDDKFTVYFISPKCFVVDDCSYGVGFPFSDTFVSITQYRFETDITFNAHKGKFEFNMRCSIRFLVKFLKSCMFERAVSEAGYNTASTDIRYFIYEKMKTVVDNQGKMFSEMFDKIADENIERKVRFKEIIIEGEDDDEETDEGNEEEQNNKLNHSRIEMQKQVVNYEVCPQKSNTNKTFVKVKKYALKYKQYLLTFIFFLIIINLLRNKILLLGEYLLEIVERYKTLIDFNFMFNIVMLVIILYLLVRVKEK